MAAMVFKKRVFAPIVLAWTLATAGMAAVAYTAAPDAQPLGRATRISLDDVQVGERGNQTRIAFLCNGACVLEKRDGGAYYLGGVDASFSLDLSKRSKRVQRLRAMPQGAGALLRIDTDSTIEYASVKNCTVGGYEAACLDLFFDPESQGAPSRAAGVSSAARNDKTVQHAATPSRKTASAKKPAPVPVKAAAKPVLREGAPDRFKRFAQLAAPERLEPPAGAILAKVQPIEKTVEVRKPTIRASEPLVEPVKVDFTARVAALLGKELTPAYCNNAAATLQADAWALGAMVDVGLCDAARGDVVQADATLARLLEYTPDNYEALVGRALIAELAEEKGVARKYYQDALNSLPPIEESNRIVQAMAALE